MIRYHLKKVFRPLVMIVIIFCVGLTSYVFRSGGNWTGTALFPATILQYWSSITTFLIIGLIPALAPHTAQNPEHDIFTIVRPSLSHAIKDQLIRALALLMPFLIVGIFGCVFFIVRLEDAETSFYATIGTQSPVNSRMIIYSFILGPLVGFMMIIALTEFIGTIVHSNLTRIITAVVLIIMDATNRLQSPLTSVSGTALAVVQNNCCGKNISTIDNYILDSAYWGSYVYTKQGGAIEGPVDTALATSLISMRVSLAVLALALLTIIPILRHKQLSKVLNHS